MTVAERINKESNHIPRIILALKNCYFYRFIGDWYVEYIFADGSVLEIRYYHDSILTKVRR